MVCSSMPGITIILLWAALTTASTLSQLLWSVTAMASNPQINAILTILLGVMSSSLQGDKAEWICRSIAACCFMANHPTVFPFDKATQKVQMHHSLKKEVLPPPPLPWLLF